jgi:hypothetical protein
MTESAPELHPLWHGAAIDKSHWHFHAQLFRRYGIVLGPGDFSTILKSIKSGRARLVCEQPAGGAIYRVRVRSSGERIYVFAEGERLITALPLSRRLRTLAKQLLE